MFLNDGNEDFLLTFLDGSYCRKTLASSYKLKPRNLRLFYEHRIAYILDKNVRGKLFQQNKILSTLFRFLGFSQFFLVFILHDIKFVSTKNQRSTSVIFMMGKMMGNIS